MTFDWSAAWSVIGFAAIPFLWFVMIFTALYAGFAAEEKLGLHSGTVFTLVLLLLAFVVMGFVGGAA